MPSAWLVPIVHPAAILRGSWELDPCQPKYLERARKLAAGTWLPEDVKTPPSGANLFPTLADLDAWRAGIDERGVSCDIENAGGFIRAIGFARLNDLAYVCLHFRTQGGAVFEPSWLRERCLFAAELLADESVPIVFHNGVSHDVPILEAVGYVVAGPVRDTILMAHNAYAELPKGLQFQSILWLGASAWKQLVRESDEGEGK